MVLKQCELLYKYRVPQAQTYKLHFDCGLPSSESLAFVQDLMSENAPCFKWFDPSGLSAESKGEMAVRHLEARRLQGYARGTLFLPNFEESESASLAELCLKLSQRFPKDGFGSLDYSAAYLPYCPGVFLRKAFRKSSAYPDRYDYVSALQVEHSLNELKLGVGEYSDFHNAVHLRSELRKSKSYSALKQAIHDAVMSGFRLVLALLETSSSQSVTVQETRLAARSLQKLMFKYQSLDYYKSPGLLVELEKAAVRMPRLKAGILKRHHDRFKAELTRAASFLKRRMAYKARIDLGIKSKILRQSGVSKSRR